MWPIAHIAVGGSHQCTWMACEQTVCKHTCACVHHHIALCSEPCSLSCGILELDGFNSDVTAYYGLCCWGAGALSFGNRCCDSAVLYGVLHKAPMQQRTSLPTEEKLSEEPPALRPNLCSPWALFSTPAVTLLLTSVFFLSDCSPSRRGWKSR